jgi:hypothetical protein
MYIVPAHGPVAACRWWDENVPIGSRVRIGEFWFTTWAHASSQGGPGPCVFVEEIERPVRISRVVEIVTPTQHLVLR